MFFRGTIAAGFGLLLICLPLGGGIGAFMLPADTETVVSSALPADADPTEQPGGADIGPRFPLFLHRLRSELGTAADQGERRQRGKPREVLLSFDDGPDLHGTPLVLDALDRHGRKGIFFVNGRYLLGSRPVDLARRELVRKLAAHGHLVANHTLNHRNLCQSPDATAEEIDTNTEVITYATGIRPLLFRSPYGARCRGLDQALRDRDLIQVGWNLDPQEWRRVDQQAVFNYVTERLSHLGGRAILLLHDTHPATVRALPRILDWIDQENARARADGSEPIRVVDYSVLLPEHPVPAIGIEPVFARLAQALSLLPGTAWAETRVGRVE
jgi:peptidoglycan/xylan/chitin deacetylase (PgdA/CDA1 family)